MKCVQYLLTNEIARVENDEAHRLVANGRYRYVPKSEWKKASRPAKTDASA